MTAVVSIMTAVLTPIIETSGIETSGQQGRVGVVDSLEGSASVTRHPARSRPLAAKDDVFRLDKIATGSESKAVIQFSAEAWVVLGYRSIMTISEESGALVLDLDTGVVNYRASREGKRSREPQAIRTPNAIARTTGRLIVRVSREPAMAVVTTVCALEGRGSAAVLDGAKVEVSEGNCVTVNGNALSTLFPLPPPPVPLPSGKISSSAGESANQRGRSPAGA